MATFTKELWTEADVQCPFYHSDLRAELSIRCEGFADRALNISKFKSMKDFQNFMGCYCVSGYERCPHYKCVCEAKYNDGK